MDLIFYQELDWSKNVFLQYTLIGNVQCNTGTRDTLLRLQFCVKPNNWCIGLYCTVYIFK